MLVTKKGDLRTLIVELKKGVQFLAEQVPCRLTGNIDSSLLCEVLPSFRWRQSTWSWTLQKTSHVNTRRRCKPHNGHHELVTVHPNVS